MASAATAIAGIECALIDLKARALGISTGPGWGTELVEEELKKHLWQEKKSSW